MDVLIHLFIILTVNYTHSNNNIFQDEDSAEFILRLLRIEIMNIV